MPFRLGNEPGQSAPQGTFRAGPPAPAPAPPQLKPDQGLGFVHGIDQIPQNLATWGTDALNAMHVPAWAQHALAQTGWRALNLPPDFGEQLKYNRAYEQQRAQEGYRPGKIGALVGQGLTSLPLAPLGGPMLQGALAGALGTADPHDAKGAVRDAVLGAIFAKGGDMVAGGVSHLVQPHLRPATQALVDNGVQLTPGQIMGGTAKRVEDAATSVPGVGDLIKSAQSQSVKTFNRAAINRSLAPIGEKLPPNLTAGRDAVDYAGRRLGEAFESAKPAQGITMDPGFNNDLADALSAGAILPKPRQVQLAKALKTYVRNRFDPATNAISPEAVQLTDRELGQFATKYGGSSDADEQVLGGILGNVQEGFRNLAGRQDPAYAKAMGDAREGWANFARVRTAAASAGAKEGVFSPASFAQAVRSGDRSVGKGAFATGSALGQDLADAGQAVLPSTVPDSGSATRGLLALALLGAGGHAHMLNPGTIAAGVGMAAPYTAPGLAASRYLLAGSRPAWAPGVADAIDQFGRPALTGVSTQTARMLADILSQSASQPTPAPATP